jgi:hypothetical protein
MSRKRQPTMAWQFVTAHSMDCPGDPERHDAESPSSVVHASAHCRLPQWRELQFSSDALDCRYLVQESAVDECAYLRPK